MSFVLRERLENNAAKTRSVIQSMKARSNNDPVNKGDIDRWQSRQLY